MEFLFGAIISALVTIGVAIASNQSQEKIAKEQQMANDNALTASMQNAKDMTQMQIDSAEKINEQNIESAENIANQQMDLDKEMNTLNLEFQKQENQITREREDNSLQRKLADGLKAGLSPLGAFGYTGASSSALTSPQVNYSGSQNALSNMISNIVGSRNNMSNSINNAYGNQLNALTQNTMKKIDSNNAMMNYKAQALNTRLQALQSIMQNFTNLQDLSIRAKQNQASIDNINEMTKTQKYKNEYYDKHGYSELDLSTILTNLLDKNNINNETIPSVSDVVDKIENTQTIKNLKTNIPSLDYTKQQKKWINDINDGNNNLSITTRVWFQNMIERYHHTMLPLNWYSRFKNNKGYRDNLLDLFNQAMENGFR